jgi:hypothetical protein
MKSMKEMTRICLLAVIFFAFLAIAGTAEITAPVDIIVLKGGVGVDNASVRVDGLYRGATAMGGQLHVPDLTLGYHTVNVQYEDHSGKYVGNSGFQIQPGITTAKVYLVRSG